MTPLQFPNSPASKNLRGLRMPTCTGEFRVNLHLSPQVLVARQGTSIHEGILASLTGSGHLDRISKPLHGPDRWNILVFFRES